MTSQKSVDIVAPDGLRLQGTLFVPEHPVATVLLCSATGIKQQFYWSFAQWLRAQNHVVLTFDYRGIGASLHGRSVRDSPAKKHEWGIYDMPAALDYLLNEYSRLPAHLVGHSAGGQLVGLMRNHARLERVVTVGSSSGYLQNFTTPVRPLAALVLKAFIPWTAKVLGYVPTSWIGYGEDLPAGVALQWARWCTSPGYASNAFGSDVKRNYYDDVEAKILWLTASDDPLATPANVDDMIRLFSRAEITRLCVEPATFGLQKIAHVDFFRKRNAALWPVVADWFSGRTPAGAN